MARNSSRNLWTAHVKGKAAPRGSATPPKVGGEPFSGTVLGIDPSLRGTGLAVATFTRGQLTELHETLTVKIPPSRTMPQCTALIWESVTGMCERHAPDCVAMENAIYVQNFQTALILGAARGSAMAAAALKGLEVHEYAPLRIKQAVTGLGRASKDQVASMVQSLAGKADPLPSDEADATAVAICHAATWRGAP